MRDNVRRWLVLRRHGSCSWVGLNDTALIKADGNFWVAVIEALLMDSFLICFFFSFFFLVVVMDSVAYAVQLRREAVLGMSHHR